MWYFSWLSLMYKCIDRLCSNTRTLSRGKAGAQRAGRGEERIERFDGGRSNASHVDENGWCCSKASCVRVLSGTRCRSDMVRVSCKHASRLIHRTLRSSYAGWCRERRKALLSVYLHVVFQRIGHGGSPIISIFLTTHVYSAHPFQLHCCPVEAAHA